MRRKEYRIVFNSRVKNGGSAFVVGNTDVTMEEEAPVAKINNFEDDVPDEDDDMVLIRHTVIGEVKKEDEEGDRLFDDFVDYDGNEEERGGTSDEDSKSFDFEQYFPSKDNNAIVKHSRCEIVGGTRGAAGGSVVTVLKVMKKMAIVKDRDGNKFKKLVNHLRII